jgi:hypothetical protein
VTCFRVPRGVVCSALAERAVVVVWHRGADAEACHMDAYAVVWHMDTAPRH